MPKKSKREKKTVSKNQHKTRAKTGRFVSKKEKSRRTKIAKTRRKAPRIKTEWITAKTVQGTNYTIPSKYWIGGEVADSLDFENFVFEILSRYKKVELERYCYWKVEVIFENAGERSFFSEAVELESASGKFLKYFIEELQGIFDRLKTYLTAYRADEFSITDVFLCVRGEKEE